MAAAAGGVRVCGSWALMTGSMFPTPIEFASRAITTGAALETTHQLGQERLERRRCEDMPENEGTLTIGLLPTCNCSHAQLWTW